MKRILLASSSDYQLIDAVFDDLRQQSLQLVFIPSSPLDYLFKAQQESEIIGKLQLNLKRVISLSNQESPRQWQQALRESDILYFHGGNPLIFKQYLIEKGCFELIKSLDNKVMIGISAGAMLLSNNIVLTPSNEEYSDFVIEPGLGCVPLNIMPHQNYQDVVSSAVMTGDGLIQLQDLMKLSETVAIDLLSDQHFIVYENGCLTYHGKYFYQLYHHQLVQLNQNQKIPLQWINTKIVELEDVTTFNKTVQNIHQTKAFAFFQLHHQKEIEINLFNSSEIGHAYQQADAVHFKSWLIEHPYFPYLSISLKWQEGQWQETIRFKSRFLKRFEQERIWPLLD